MHHAGWELEPLNHHTGCSSNGDIAVHGLSQHIIVAKEDMKQLIGSEQAGSSCENGICYKPATLCFSANFITVVADRACCYSINHGSTDAATTSFICRIHWEDVAIAKAAGAQAQSECHAN